MPDGHPRRYYGYTKVLVPGAVTNGINLCVREVVNYGLAIGGGSIGLGRNYNKEIALPARGALYVEVSTPEQFESIRKFLITNPDYPVCIIQKPTPRR